MRATSIILVRHGHTEQNSGGPNAALTGWSDPPLSNAGRQEARRLRGRLAGDWAAVYSSSSRRARETAQLALADHEPVRIEVLPELREIHCGWLEGWPLQRIKREHPELWQRNEREDDPDFRWPGGESYQEFRARCVKAMQHVVSASPAGPVLVFTHAGVVSQLVGSASGTSPAKWSCHRPHTCSLTEIFWAHGARAIVRFDDHAHLLAA